MAPESRKREGGQATVPRSPALFENPGQGRGAVKAARANLLDEEPGSGGARQELRQRRRPVFLTAPWRNTRWRPVVSGRSTMAADRAAAPVESSQTEARRVAHSHEAAARQIQRHMTSFPSAKQRAGIRPHRTGCRYRSQIPCLTHSLRIHHPLSRDQLHPEKSPTRLKTRPTPNSLEAGLRELRDAK